MKKFLLTFGAALLTLTASAATNLILAPNSDFETGTAPGWSGWGGTKEVVTPGYNSEYCLSLTPDEGKTNQWDSQAVYNFSSPFKVGTPYTLTFYAKSTVDGCPMQTQYQNSSSGNQGGYSSYTLSTEWTKYTSTFTITNDTYTDVTRIVINYGTATGTIFIDDIVLTGPDEGPSDNPAGVPANAKLIISGNTADGNMITEWSDKLENSTVDGTPCIKYTNTTAGNSYDIQLAIDYNYEPDKMYYISFDVMGTPSTVSIGAWYQYKATYTALGYSDFNSFSVTSSDKWTPTLLYGKYTAGTLADGGEMLANRVAINLGEYVGTMYITNIKVYVEDDGTEPEPEPEPGFTVPEGYVIAIEGDTADGTKIVEWSDKLNNTTYEGESCIEYTNDTEGNSYSTQLAIDYLYQQDVEYYIVFDVMGTPSAASIPVWYQDTASGDQDYSAWNGFNITSENEWTEVVLKGKYTETDKMFNRVVFNLGEYVGTAYFTNIRLYAPESDPGVSTVIKTVETMEAPKGVYNLMGIKVASDINGVAPGLYIVDGKKVLVRK